MKRFLCLVLALLTMIPFFGCNSQSEKYDNLALPFIKAILAKDEEEMKKYLHPDYIDSALPNEAFYDELSKQYFSVGSSLDALDSIAKSDADELELDGTAKKCTYVARTNELFYTVDLIILENDNGYGIVSVAMLLNTDPKYYQQTEN